MEYHHDPPVTLGDREVKVTDLDFFFLKFYVQVVRSLYLLNMLMDQVDRPTLHVCRYIELKFYAFTTHLSDL